MKSTRRLVAILTVIGVFAITPAAFAQSAGEGYQGQAGGIAGQIDQGGGDGAGGVAGQVTGGGDEGGSGATNVSSGGDGVLPFTGLDLALIVGGGLVLLAGGVALSRLVARHPA